MWPHHPVDFVLHSTNSISAFSLSWTDNSHVKCIFSLNLLPLLISGICYEFIIIFSFCSQIYFNSVIHLIKNFYLSFNKIHKVWKCPLSRSFKREKVRRNVFLFSFSIIFFFPSLLFFCVFPCAFPFIPLKHD